MADIQLVCPVTPDANFSYEAGQTRYTEQLSFVLLHNISLAVGGGMTIQYVTESEAAAVESAFDAASAAWMSFIDTIVPEASSVDVPAIPDPTDVDKYTGGGWEGFLLQLALRVAGRLLSRWIEKWLGFGESGNVDTDEIEAQLAELNSNLLASMDVLSSFRLSLDLDGATKSASVGLTGVLEQVAPDV